MLWLLLLLLVLFIVISALAIVRLNLGVCKSHRCLIGKTAIVTGGNSGIGYETCLNLASRGCKVIIADIADSEQSRLNIIKKTHNPNIHSRKLNLASFKSIREFTQDINKTEDRLDILVNNAGILNNTTALTEDGFNAIWQVNYLGPFLLTHLLVDLLKKSTPSRIVFTSSVLAHIFQFDALAIENKLENNATKIYARTKLANIIASDLFAGKLKKSGVASNSVHPGLVFGTNISNVAQQQSSMISEIISFVCFAPLKPFLKNPWQGAQTTIHAAVAEDLDGITGECFADCRKCSKPSALADRKSMEKFWRLSENYVKLSELEKL